MKRLLVVVDFQNDFVDGSLGFPGAEKLQGPIASLIHSFKESKDDIVFTKDLHSQNYLHSEEGHNLPIMHCIEGTEGAKIYGYIDQLSNGYPVFAKPAFGSEELGLYVKKHEYESITLCGIDGSICVFANAMVCKVMSPNAHIVVDASATGSNDLMALKTAYAAMRRLHIEVINVPSELQ